MGYSLPSSCTAFASPAWSIHLGIYGKPFFTCIIQHQRKLSFTHIKHRNQERWHLSWFQLSLQLIYFRYGSNTCSHCVEEWQKPIRYGTLHFQDRCAAQLRSLREITVLMCEQEPIRQNFRIGTRTAFWYSVNLNQILLPMVLRCPRFSRTRARNSNRTK